MLLPFVRFFLDLIVFVFLQIIFKQNLIYFIHFTKWALCWSANENKRWNYELENKNVLYVVFLSLGVDRYSNTSIHDEFYQQTEASDRSDCIILARVHSV